MKLYTILAFALMVTLVFATASVLAEDTVISGETSTSSAIASEVNDNLNESVSGMKIGWENMKLWFTFNNEKKAIQELKIARLRLIQAKVAAQNGNTEAMQSALDAHDKLLERVKARVDSIDGDSTKEGIKLSAAKLVGLERAIEVHEARISKLNEILASTNLTDEQRAKVEERLSKVENNTEKLRALEDKKMEQVKTRLRAVTNLTEDEVESEIEELEDAQNLSDVKKFVAEVRIQHAENVLAKLKERVAEAEAKGKNVTGINLRIAQFEEALADAQALYDSGNYSEALKVLKIELKEEREGIRLKAGELLKEKAENIRERVKERLKNESEDEDETELEVENETEESNLTS